MNIKQKLSTFFSVALLATACSEAQPVLTPAEELISTLKTNIESGKIMLGHQDATVYGHTWKYEPNRSDVLELVGDYPAVMGWDVAAIEFDSLNNIDGVPFETMRNEIIAQDARGGINTISWHTYNPLGGDAWDEQKGVVTSILPGGENHEKFNTWMGKVADFFGSLKDAEGELIPIIFRPWHEHNGSWFWWGEELCSHKEYVELWDMTYKFMAERGLNNIVWCYMPNENAYDKVPAVEQFDVVGFDEYQHKGDADKYIAGFKAKMALIKEYAAKYDKIMTVSETGSESLPTENWFTEVRLPQMESEPVSYVLLWRNAWDKPEHFYCSFKGHSSEADFVKFVESPKIITVKEIKTTSKN